MRPSQVLQTVSLTLAMIMAPVLVSAQTATDKPADKAADQKPAKPADKSGTPGTQSADQAKQDPNAPKLEKLEDPEPPALKIGKPQTEHKVTEKADQNGVKVDTGVTTYYVRPNQQVGSALPGDTQSTTNRGAEWKVMEFDLGSKKKKTEEDKADDADAKK